MIFQCYHLFFICDNIILFIFESNILGNELSKLINNIFVKYLIQICFHQLKSAAFLLTLQQKMEILNSKKEYLEGKFVENDILNEEMEKWLREE